MPTNIVVNAGTFNLLAPTGEVVAVATVVPTAGGGGRIDFVLTDYADTHDDVGGTAFFNARWDQSDITPGTTESVTFVSGGVEFTDT